MHKAMPSRVEAGMEEVMKKLLVLSLAAAVGGCMAEGPIESTPEAQTMLAQSLEGRVQSGPAVSCVSQRDLRGTRSVGESAIIFGGQSKTVYVNRPPNGCPAIDSGRALRTQSTSTQLCRGDIVSAFEPLTGHEFGSCSLGDFTPYTRVR
jgi:hypothetical protein